MRTDALPRLHVLPVRGGVLVRGVAPGDRRRLRDGGGRTVRALRAYDAPTVATATLPAARCPVCARGRPCAAWDVAALDRSAYLPRVADAPGCVAWREAAAPVADARLREAAAALGVPWPCDAAAVEAGFRAAVQGAHPDHPGGSAAALHRLVAARATLRGALP